MASEDSPLLDKSESPTEVYKVRWAFLFVLTILQSANGFNYAGFGQISDFYRVYFDVSFAQVDWLTLSSMTAVIFSSAFLAWLSFRELVNLRRLICAGAIFTSVSFCLISFGVSGRNRFAAVIAGQVGNGMAASALIAAPPIFAVAWFPNNEIGLAMSLVLVGISCGSILGYTLPANIIIPLGDEKNMSLTDEWASENRAILMRLYLSLTAVALSTAVVFLCFLPNHPPKPPNFAEVARNAELDRQRMNGEYRAEAQSFLAHLREMLTPTYVLAIIAFGIVFHVNTLELTLMSEIVASIPNVESSNLNSDQISGYVMCVLAFGGFLGCLVGGAVLDKFQRPQVQASFASLTCFLASLGLVLGYVKSTIWVIGISNFFYGLAIRMCIIPLYKIAIEQSYPMEEKVVSPFLVGAQALFGVTSAELGRLVYEFGGGLWVLVFQSIWLLVALVVIVVARPDYRRQMAEHTEEAKQHDTKSIERERCNI